MASSEHDGEPGEGSLSAIQKIRDVLGKDNSGEGWDIIWQKNVTPWDKGSMQEPLRELVESGEIQFPVEGRALVPGCGRGYEAVYIASKLGFDTVAMDISPTAIDAAKKNAASTSLPAGGSLTFVCGDFFNYNVPHGHLCHVAFDYTFFVAIPPSLRPLWGSQMRALVRKGGYLITLIFPIDGDRPGGPPYSVNTAMYSDALLAGEGEWSKVLERQTSTVDRVGRERIVVWRRN